MKLDTTNNEIAYLVGKIESNELDLQPNFQRGQIWTESKKKRLIDSVLREWYIPPVHVVVNDELNKEEILDGQQRLRAIFEFVHNKYPVDGFLEPRDENVKALHGLYYNQLPPSVKSRFNRFPIATVRLRDYSAGEPGELFFRLNQLSSLTAAEQRNALFGPARDQIKLLSDLLEERSEEYSLGFSNARMNYDDVLSRLALSVENGGLAEKITAGRLEARYRSGTPFSDKTIVLISNSIKRFTRGLKATDIRLKFNKATAFSWMYFLIDNRWPNEQPYVEDFAYFLAGFEIARSHARPLGNMHAQAANVATKLSNEAYPLTRVFTDRATSRVNDVSSIILRDICLNASLMWSGPRSFREVDRFSIKADQLHHIYAIYKRYGERGLEQNLEREAFNIGWGMLR